MEYFGILFEKLLYELFIAYMAATFLSIGAVIVYLPLKSCAGNKETEDVAFAAVVIYALVSWTNVVIWRLWDNRVFIWSILNSSYFKDFVFYIFCGLSLDFIRRVINKNNQKRYQGKKESLMNVLGAVTSIILMIVFYNN